MAASGNGLKELLCSQPATLQKKKRRRHKFDYFKELVQPSFSPEHLLATAFEPLKHIN